jgi:hypothetical protein
LDAKLLAYLKQHQYVSYHQLDPSYFVDRHYELVQVVVLDIFSKVHELMDDYKRVRAMRGTIPDRQFLEMSHGIMCRIKNHRSLLLERGFLNLEIKEAIDYLRDNDIQALTLYEEPVEEEVVSEIEVDHLSAYDEEKGSATPHLYLDQILKKMDYDDLSVPKRNGNGQWKLYYHLLRLLGTYPSVDTIIYVGSAPGYSISALAKEVPHITFYCSDYNGTIYEGQQNLIALPPFPQFMEERAFGENVLLISDAISSEALSSQLKRDKWDDIQYEMVKKIRPYAYSLKRLIPYRLKKMRFFNTSQKMLQVFSKSNSSEIREVGIYSPDSYFVYTSVVNVDRKNSYYNQVIRRHPAIALNKATKCKCYDCYMMGCAIERFSAVHSSSISSLYMNLKRINDLSAQGLNLKDHFYIRDDLPITQEIATYLTDNRIMILNVAKYQWSVEEDVYFYYSSQETLNETFLDDFQSEKEYREELGWVFPFVYDSSVYIACLVTSQFSLPLLEMDSLGNILYKTVRGNFIYSLYSFCYQLYMGSFKFVSFKEVTSFVPPKIITSSQLNNVTGVSRKVLFYSEPFEKIDKSSVLFLHIDRLSGLETLEIERGCKEVLSRMSCPCGNPYCGIACTSDLVVPKNHQERIGFPIGCSLLYETGQLPFELHTCCKRVYNIQQVQEMDQFDYT